MPQVTLHLDEYIAARLEMNAKAKGLSVADYLLKIVRREVGQEWPEEFFHEVVEAWAGEPLERPPQEGVYETRESL